MSIKNLPSNERPREKIWNKGVDALSDAELLAVLLRTGSKNRSVLDIARSLVASPEKTLKLGNMKAAELALEKGIGPAKAVTVIAALELGRRISIYSVGDIIETTQDAVKILAPQIAHEDREVFLVLLLNAKGKIIYTEKLTVGTHSAAIVSPKDIFYLAVIHKAVAVIVAHNHPSGDCNPSEDDIVFTKGLVDGGRLLDTPVVDHIIIGDNDYYSFSESKKFAAWFL